MRCRMLLLLLLLGWALQAATGVVGVPEILGLASALSPEAVPLAAVRLPMQGPLHVLRFHRAWRAYRAAAAAASQSRGKRRRAPPRRLPCNDAFAILDLHTDAECVEAFGLDRATIEAVASIIRDDVECFHKGRADARNAFGNGANHTAELQLLATLRWLRGGSHHDIRLWTGSSKRALFSMLTTGSI